MRLVVARPVQPSQCHVVQLCGPLGHHCRQQARVGRVGVQPANRNVVRKARRRYSALPSMASVATVTSRCSCRSFFIEPRRPYLADRQSSSTPTSANETTRVYLTW